jgi:aminoglycoside/choline kinase family phosphotransferase
MNQLFASTFKQIFSHDITSFEPVNPHASERRMVRLKSDSQSAIALIDPNPKEFEAFIMLTRHFLSFNLSVPKLYHVDLEKGFALLEDLGMTTLLEVLLLEKDPSIFPPHIARLYMQAIEALPQFQIGAGKSVDFKRCYPRHSFDKESMLYDMRLFVREYLSRSAAKFKESDLEKEFDMLADFLLKAPADFFMYRDFQSRNIMVRDGKLAFIDYQLGRKGPLQYDVVSLLYQSRAQVPADLREQLIKKYISSVSSFSVISADQFLEYFPGFVLIRLMQVLGRYGELGLGKKKQMFIDNIPYALQNLRGVLANLALPIPLPYLLEILNKI